MLAGHLLDQLSARTFYWPFSSFSLVLAWSRQFVGNHAKNPSVHHGWIAGRKKSSRRIVLQPTTKGELWGSRRRKFVSPYRQVGCTGFFNFLWKKAQPYRWGEQGTLLRNCLLYLPLKRDCLLYLPLKRELSKPKRLSSSSRVIIQLTLLHAYTRANRKRFRSKDDLGKGAGFPRMIRRPCPRISCRTPLFPFLSGENVLNKDLISRTTATGCLQCNKQLC